ncbi:MAG: glycosyltransferase [Patescibacteria group bacterium]
MANKISVIIVNYCTKGLIQKCIDNLLESYSDIEVLFIDNDSPDGSADEVKRLYSKNPRVTLIECPNNGQPYAYNKALDIAKGKYILYLGTDAFPTKESLIEMTKYLDENLKVGGVSPHLYQRDGSSDIDAHRGFPTPWNAITHMVGLAKLFPNSKLFNGYYMSYLGLDSRHKIGACITHCMMVKRSVQDAVGRWDEDYFIFGEDIDFCYKIAELGYEVHYLGDVRVLHYKGATVGRDTAKDIENIINTDFGSATFRGKKIISAPRKDEPEGKKKKMSNTARWMKIKITKEKTRAMRLFYKKHYDQKYPKILNRLVLVGISFAEFMKVAKVLIKSYF